MSTKLQGPCGDPNVCALDSTAGRPLTVEDAIARILAFPVTPLAAQTLPLDQALGRVLAEPLNSAIDQPAWDHSAMDGYALRYADLEQPSRRWPISQRIPAGGRAAPLQPGSAARILTGALMPPGADTVVVQEICTTDNGELALAAADIPAIQRGANIRKRGEDIGAGDPILSAGTRLGAQHLALAASVGQSSLPVYRRLRVAILSSGDELVMPGEPLAPGQIYNSNRFMLHGLLRGLGCEVIDRGMLPDRLEPTLDALQQAAAAADLVIASGGVSVGEEDHVRPAVEQLGHVEVAKVAMRPGKPVAVGSIGSTAFLGSPGNPVSLFVTFVLFARPLILKLQGVTTDLLPQVQRASAAFATRKADPRREYRRARLVSDAQGQVLAQVFPSQSSAAITSLTWANALVVIPEHTQIERGDAVDVLPLRELLG